MKVNRCCLILILIITGIFLVPIKEEEDLEMKARRYKALGITSTKKPVNTHLFNEHTDATLIIVPTGDEMNIYQSVDKAATWSSAATGVQILNPIKAGSPDRDNDDIWYLSDGSVNGNIKFFVYHIDTNSQAAGFVLNAGYLGFDVFFYSGDYYPMFTHENGANLDLTFRKGPGVSWSNNMGARGALTWDTSQVVVIGGYAWFLWKWSNENVELWKWQIGTANFTEMEDCGANTELPPINQRAIAYDGSNIITFVLQDTSDSKYYLYTYAIDTDILTKGAEHNVALMLDRNTASGVLEKAFGISNEIVYELKPKRGGIIQLQDVSALSDNNLIAITDNFLMNDDGDMFEWTDIVDEISAISYNDGIMGIEKKGSLIAHPDFHTNWSKGDSIKIYDQYDQLEFWGKITAKNQNQRGLYIIKIDSFTNEILRKTYSTTYSADDTDTKQKDIIDNACDFCYRSSSIVGTTTTYDYVYNRAIIYLFWLARRLERQVPYIESDGKIWTKAYDGLAKNAMIYPGKYNFKEMADGTQGTDIDWLDSVLSADDHEIISEISGHRKVLRTFQNSGAGDCVHVFASSSLNGWLEFHVNVTDANAINNIIITREGGSVARIWMIIDNDRFEYDAGAGMVDAGKAVVDDTWYHVYVEWYSDNTFDFWVDGTQYLNGVSTFSDFTASGPTRWDVDQDTVGAKYIYIDSPQSSLDDDPAYTKGDNEVAWDLNNHWQDVRFIDIPGIRETIQGFFDGNTGITRNTIRYKNNASTIRPVAATRDPIEQLKGISPLNELRDPKIEASTEADQLGDNRYAIWSKDTIYLGLSIGGQGYLQPGKTVHVENTGQITVAESNLVVLSFIRDPKNDEYRSLILSDNIILPSEFTNIDNTTPQQTHTAIVQTLENQANMNTGYSTEDADLTFIFGRAQIDSRFADMMLISHRDMSAQDNYAFGQLNDGKTYINAPTGKLIYFQINDITKMSMSAASLNMGTNKITGMGDPINDQDAATKKYAKHNIASDDLVFSNDGAKFNSSATYVKRKEIIAYRSGDIRVYHETKINVLGSTVSRVYVNGVAVGVEHTTSSGTYVSWTDDLTGIVYGDLIQIYMKHTGAVDLSYVQNQRIKYTEFVSNDP